jgi:hypothetical protein
MVCSLFFGSFAFDIEQTSTNITVIVTKGLIRIVFMASSLFVKFCFLRQPASGALLNPHSSIVSVILQIVVEQERNYQVNIAQYFYNIAQYGITCGNIRTSKFFPQENESRIKPFVSVNRALVKGFSSLGSAVLGWSHAGLPFEDLR